MTKKARQKPNEKWGGGGFAAIPHRVLQSPTFATLSSDATKLLFDLVSQYRGSNNGDLCASMTLMKKRGWNSNASLTKARKELETSGLTRVSRMGGRNQPTLYVLTFYSIDECRNTKTGLRKHDLEPTRSPSNDFLLNDPVPDIIEAQRRHRAKN